MPSSAVNFLCGSLSTDLGPLIRAWIGQEAQKYAMPMPIGTVSCASQQVTLPASLTVNGTIVSDGYATVQEPLDQDATLTYLTTNAAVPPSVQSAINSSRHVAIIHYVPTTRTSIPSFIPNAIMTRSGL